MHQQDVPKSGKAPPPQTLSELYTQAEPTLPPSASPPPKGERIPPAPSTPEPVEEEEPELFPLEAVAPAEPGTTPQGAPKLTRLEKLERQKAQIEAQIKALQARESEKERKARTRRLIQYGAITCKYLNIPDTLSPAEFEARMKQVAAIVKKASPQPPQQEP